MRWPRVQFTVQGIMVATAALAVSSPMALGIIHLPSYPSDLERERYYRENAAISEAKKEAEDAAGWRKIVEEKSRSNRESWGHVTTFSSLVGLGIVFGASSMVLRMRYGSVRSARPRSVNVLAAICLIGTKILCAGLILAGVALAGFLIAMTIAMTILEALLRYS
jgi:hypothetical protein